MTNEISPPTHRYSITASVRKAGALGVFYDKDFEIFTTWRLAGREEVVDLFLSHCGQEWELNHLVSYEETKL